MAEQGGLLSFLNSPTGMGLLSAVGAGLAGSRRGQPINALGMGLMSGVQGYVQGQDLQQQQAFNQQRSKLFDAQMQNYQAEADARRAALEQQQRQREYMSTIGKVTSPRLDAQPNQASPRQMLGLGFSPDFVKTYMTADNLGREEVARTLEGIDANGRKVTYQFDKYGRPVGDALPAYIAPVQVDTGGSVKFVTPQAGIDLRKSMSPEAAASNALGWANNSIARQRLTMDQQQLMQPKPEFKEGQWIVPPRDMKPGETRSVVPPTSARDATEALNLINQARQLLPNATGSYGGLAVDQTARFFGKATEGAKSTAQLQAIEGALVSKMPKMSGPQSDKDVALYKQMAGVVGDPTVPVEQRQAALNTIEQIQQRYAGQGGASGSFASPTPQGKTVLRTGTMNGRKVVQYSDGTTSYAD